MKKFLVFMTLVAGISFSLDFACVDTNKVIRESKFIAKAQSELRRELEKYQKLIQEKQKELTRLKKSLESKVLSEKAKEKKVKRIEQLEEELRKLQVEAQSKLSRKKAELERMVFEKVIKVVKAIAKKRKIKAVFDCNSMLYWDKSIDITSEVLRELDK